METEIKDEEFARLLLSLSPRKIVKFIEHLDQNTDFDNEKDFTTGIKAWFVRKAFRKLDINTCVCSRSKTFLHICTVTGKPLLVVSKTDARKMDVTEAKIYDSHSDLLLELVEKHESQTLELAGVS